MRMSATVAAAGTLLLAGALAGCTGPAGHSTQPGPARYSSGPAATPPAGTAACPPSAGTAVARGGLPDLTLACITGPGTVDLAKVADGTPMVINLWASWCDPCRAEMPYLAHLSEQAGDRLTVLGVLSDDPTENWPFVLQDTGARYASVRDDPGTLGRRLIGPGLPGTVFVKADGTVASARAVQWHSQAALDAAVQDALGVTVTG